MELLLSVLIKGVGSGIAKGILNIWLKDENMPKEIAKNIVSILAAKTNDVIAQGSGKRQFEEIRDKVALSLLPIFNSVGDSISEERKIEIGQLAGAAINTLEISSELLVGRNLDPQQIETLLLQEARFPNEENPLMNYNEEEMGLYKRVISEASQYMVDIASTLPTFTEKTFAEVLKRQGSIIDKANTIFEEVARMRRESESSDERANEFETNYRRAVVRRLDELQLFGVDLSGTSKRYRLSTAYVRLSVEYSDSNVDLPESTDEDEEELEQSELLSIDEAISRSNRLLLRGSAGSGKTTLMQWVAVMASGKNMKAELEDWNNCIPFFIRLREFSDKDLPQPEDFPALISPAVSGDKPKRWVIDQLKSKRAIILVDGVDELAEGQRVKIKTWLKDINGAYPANRWVVTTRPHAADKGWLSEFDFMDADLQDMSKQDVTMFVEHWHAAVKEAETHIGEKEELDILETKLKSTIRENRNLRKLATNPLLCAMICALHRDRTTQLPSDRIELYEACINMFIRRDIERQVSLKDYVKISDRQKRALLADFAYWLIKNGWSEIELGKADERFQKKIVGFKDIPEITTGEGVRRYFVERSGILRQPTVNTIDFPHRTFEEYLAAKAIVEEGDFGVLSNKSTNDQWREVIQLACGIARSKEANETILNILKLGDNNKKNQATLHLLAVTCLDTMIEIDIEVQKEVQKRLKALVPPISLAAAKELVKVGDLIVDFLKRGNVKKVKGAATSVRALALLGTEVAFDALYEYTQEEDRLVVWLELMKSASYAPDPSSYKKRFLSNLIQINLTRYSMCLKFNNRPNAENNLGNRHQFSCNALRNLVNLQTIICSDIELTNPKVLLKLNSLKLIEGGKVNYEIKKQLVAKGVKII